MGEIAGVAQVTEHVFIAGARAIYSVPELREAGITRVLKLYFDDPCWPGDFKVLEHPLEDGVFIPKEALEQGLSFIRATVEAGHRSGRRKLTRHLGPVGLGEKNRRRAGLESWGSTARIRRSR